jgi:HAE1 family hydrophobic/amphiphilic exporter-1
LRRVPGVARVDLNGVEPREIDIDLILDKIKEHNVDVGRLIRTLQSASSNMVLGQVNDKGMRYTVRALGQFATVEEIENLVIDERGLRVKDIAEVTYEEPPLTYGRHLDGQYAVALEAYKESTANTVDVVRGIIKVINEDIANDDLLQGTTRPRRSSAASRESPPRERSADCSRWSSSTSSCDVSRRR